jgi:hypothetical protein
MLIIALLTFAALTFWSLERRRVSSIALHAVGAITLIAAMSSPAWAASASETSGGQLAGLVSALAFAALVPIMGAIGLYLAGWIKTKTKLDLTDEISRGVDLAVGYAEQRGRRWLVEKGSKMPGQDKLQIAVPWLITLADQKKWPDWVKAKAEDLIEARLGQRETP